MPAGRPTDYCEEIALEIEEWLLGGPKNTLKAWCDIPGNPNYVTVWRWTNRYPEFGNMLARARMGSSWLMHDEIIEIADDKSGDVKTLKGKNGEEYDVCDTEFVQRSRVKIEARLKLMAINNRAVFGEKAVVDHRHEGTVKVSAVQSEIIEPEPLQITKVENIIDDE